MTEEPKPSGRGPTYRDLVQNADPQVGHDRVRAAKWLRWSANMTMLLILLPVVLFVVVFVALLVVL